MRSRVELGKEAGESVRLARWVALWVHDTQRGDVHPWQAVRYLQQLVNVLAKVEW